jgi:hypothetical protein
MQSSSMETIDTPALRALAKFHKECVTRAAAADGQYGESWRARGISGNLSEVIPELNDAANYYAWAAERLRQLIEYFRAVEAATQASFPIKVIPALQPGKVNWLLGKMEDTFDSLPTGEYVFCAVPKEMWEKLRGERG